MIGPINIDVKTSVPKPRRLVVREFHIDDEADFEILTGKPLIKEQPPTFWKKVRAFLKF